MTDTFFAIDTFVTTTPGEPFRLLPFGVITKGGAKHRVTRKLAEKFRLPHFKPPIKLGSHAETTPAGGHIVGLEVREDGLYAIPEFNEQGLEALNQGSFRYQSPEILWEDSGMEDSASGEIIRGPLIIGDALLHMPALGEAAALYSVDPVEENDMPDDIVQVPLSLWDKLTAWIDRGLERPSETPAPNPVTEPPSVPEEFAAAVRERDEYKSRLAAIEAERAQAAERAALVTQLQNRDEFGSFYVELRTAEEAAGMLAGMSPEAREWCMRTFKALAGQIAESALLGERGSNQPLPDNPVQQLEAAVKAKMSALGVDFVAGLELVRAENPELLTAYQHAGKGK